MATIKIISCIICLAAAGSCRMPERHVLNVQTPGLENGFQPFGQQSAMNYWLGDKRYSRSKHILGSRKTQPNTLVELAQNELGVREATGKNDGKRVETYLASVGLKKGQPYCAAFISFIHLKAGYPGPRSGWSPSLFPHARLVKLVKPGNVLGIYYPALKRIAHCGLVEGVSGNWISSIEANTSASGGREGDGVHRKKRHRKTIQKFSNWEKLL